MITTTIRLLTSIAALGSTIISTIWLCNLILDFIFLPFHIIGYAAGVFLGTAYLGMIIGSCYLYEFGKILTKE